MAARSAPYVTQGVRGRDGTPSPPLEQRVEAGLRLFDEGRAGNVIFSGGHPGGWKSQSALCCCESAFKQAHRLSPSLQRHSGS